MDILSQAESLELRDDLMHRDNPVVIDHPLLTHKLSLMRRYSKELAFEMVRDRIEGILNDDDVSDKSSALTSSLKDTLARESTTKPLFRSLAKEVSTILFYEATRKLPLEEKEITSWSGTPTKVQQLSGKKPVIVPILRAGEGMVHGVLELAPNVKHATVGFYRDEETFEPKEYYWKHPKNMDKRFAIILDPMLATGGTVCAALKEVKASGCKHIAVLSIVGAPQGVNRVLQEHPDVMIYLGALDLYLNENAYIIPGLGDAGDRIFGTK